MAVTSQELLQNLLNSINTALQNTELTEDNRGALIEQYERTATMIKEGYENLDIGLDTLSTTIRDETIALVNDVIATLTGSVEDSISSLNDWKNLFNFSSDFLRIDNINLDLYEETGFYPYGPIAIGGLDSIWNYSVLEVVKNIDLSVQKIFNRSTGQIAVRKFQNSTGLWYPWFIHEPV